MFGFVRDSELALSVCRVLRVYLQGRGGSPVRTQLRCLPGSDWEEFPPADTGQPRSRIGTRDDTVRPRLRI